MTSTHASKPLLETLPTSLKEKYFPPSTNPKSFVMNKPVKGRNEPTAIGGIAWIIHRLNEGVSFEKVTEKVYKNTVQLFGLDELTYSSQREANIEMSEGCYSESKHETAS